MTIRRLRVAWSGTQLVGPGLSTFYDRQLSPATFVASVVAFFTALQSRAPVGITWTVPGSGDLINEGTGQITGGWSEGGAADVLSSGAGTFAQGVGARIAWDTGGVVAGRHVRGSTYVVPLTSGQYGANGLLTEANRAALETAADNLVAAMAGDLVVWSRPAPGRLGTAHPVTDAVVTNRVSTVRSRRT